VKPAATLISNHRLARLTAWAGLWLQAFAAILISLNPADAPAARRTLARMAQLISYIVMLRAAALAQPCRQRPRWRAPVSRPGMRRSFIGAALRRRLRGRDPIERFFAILGVMRDLDALVARQAKRLARGLTRLRPMLPAFEDSAQTEVALPPDIAHADSS
jgi:hypothetical protein